MSKGILANDTCYSTIKHKVGNAFNTDHEERDTIDLDLARKAFDFEILKKQSCTEDGRPLPKNWHLRRSDDDSIIPTRGLGDEFQPIQHMQLFDCVAKDILPELERTKGAKLEVCGTMNGGGTAVMSIKIGDTFGITGDKSGHESRLFFFNPNGKSSVIVGMTNVRLFCENQLTAAVTTATDSAKSGNGIRVYHTKSADIKLDRAMETIYQQLQLTEALKRREERLAQIQATDANLQHLLDKLIPMGKAEVGSREYTMRMNKRQAISYQWYEGETAQTFETRSAACLLNAFTYDQFNPRSIGAGTDLAQITYSGTVGSRANRVDYILNATEREFGIC